MGNKADFREYEGISNLAEHSAIQMAEEYLAQGWADSNSPTVYIFGNMPWEFPGHELRSWNFNVHSLDMLDPLMAAHSQTLDEKYLSPALRIGLDWVRQHPRGATGVSPMAWYDMAVGLRAYRLGYLYQAAEAAELLEAGDKAALWTSLNEHRAELVDDANIAFHNNHGYFQVAGQLALGRRFKDISPSMAALYAQGAHRLRRMLDQQFGLDGVHREHSPDYHRMVADTLLGLKRADLVEDAELLARVDGIEKALAWFVTPDGSVTNFGDSHSRVMVDSAAGASCKWTTPLMQAVASNGATGSGWPKGLKVFDASGYAIVRQPDPSASDEVTRDSYLAQTAAFHSRTHKHRDDLSFVWHERGQPLLIDAGCYGYIGKTETGSDLWKEGFWYSDPMRMFMESTRAHNTLEFDGRNAQRKSVKPYGSALVQAHEKDGTYYIETRCKQHRSIWHDRLLLLRPGQWLVVFDVFLDNLKAPHDVHQWFHLAPGHKAVAHAEGFDVKLKGGGNLTVRELIGDSTPGEVESGRAEDPMQGWFSDKVRSVTPADAFSFVQSGQASGIFATLLSLSPPQNVTVELGRSNLTGRKAQLGWSDSFGRHHLSFERGEAFKLDCRVSDHNNFLLAVSSATQTLSKNRFSSEKMRAKEKPQRHLLRPVHWLRLQLGLKLARDFARAAQRPPELEAVIKEYFMGPTRARFRDKDTDLFFSETLPLFLAFVGEQLGEKVAILEVVASVLRKIAPEPHASYMLFKLHQSQGDLEMALALLRELLDGKWGALRSDVKRKLHREPVARLLAGDLLPERTCEPSFTPGDRIGYVVHNSLPYVTVGYATRTQGFADGLQCDGQDLVTITRPGFPLNVMRDLSAVDVPLLEEIDGVTYRRILEPVDRVALPYEYIRLAADSLEKAFVDEGVKTVIAASNYVCALPAIIAARRLGLPSVYEVRGFWEISAKSQDESYGETTDFATRVEMESMTACAADRVLTLTAGMREELIRRGVEPERIFLAPNGFRPAMLSQQLDPQAVRERLEIPEGCPVIGYIGSITPYEGLADLATACIGLHERGLDFRLLIVGNEKPRGGQTAVITEQIIATFANAGISGKLIMTGRVPFEEVPHYYSIVDIAPIPRKPFEVSELVSPIKPLEAMAFETALVVSSVAALTEIVTDGVTGYVFEKGNVEALRNTLMRAITEPETRRRIAAEGKRFALEERDWAKIAIKVTDFLFKNGEDLVKER